MFLGGYPKAPKIVHNRDFRNVAEAAGKPAWDLTSDAGLAFLKQHGDGWRLKGYDE